MELNKRDLFKYRKFIESIKKGSGDSFIDRCLPMLVRFIEKSYVSDESKMFDIDDFIQECLIKANSYRDKDVLSLSWSLKRDFQRIYESMSKADEYQFSEPVDLGDLYDEIDISYIDLDRVLDTVKGRLSTEGQRRVIDYIREDKDNDEIAKELGIKKNNVYELRKKVTAKIRKSPEFREYTKDSMSKFYSTYQVFVIDYSRNDSSLFNWDDLLLRYWNNSIDSRESYYYNSMMIHLLKFFYRLRDFCVEENSIYLTAVDNDINNIISIVDNGNLRPKMREEFENIISDNNTDHKTK